MKHGVDVDGQPLENITKEMSNFLGRQDNVKYLPTVCICVYISFIYTYLKVIQIDDTLKKVNDKMILRQNF